MNTVASNSVELSDGRVVTFDLLKLTLAEYRALFEPAQPLGAEDTIMARVCGMELADYQNLPYLDWRRLTVSFFEAAKNPMFDPNSVSAPTST